MKKILSIIALMFVFTTTSGQESYFTCDEVSVSLTNKSVTIDLPNLSNEKVKQRIELFIKERNYVYKPYYSDVNLISFRDFAMICNVSKCASDLIAKTLFHLAYDSGVVKITLDIEIYSSFYGGELIVNDNDDVASKNDVPFGTYEFQISEKYSDEYPESIYVFNKTGKISVKNPEVQRIILTFFNEYITDIISFLKK